MARTLLPLSSLAVSLFFDIFKPTYGLIHNFKKWNKKLPDIKIDLPEALEYYWRNREGEITMFLYYNIKLEIISKYLNSNATDCKANVRYKPRNQDEDYREGLAWRISGSPYSYNLKKGDSKYLSLFMISNEKSGVCLSDEKEPEKHFPSEITVGFYDYIIIELFCEEWKGYKKYDFNWKDIKFPDFFKRLPVKHYSGQFV